MKNFIIIPGLFVCLVLLVAAADVPSNNMQIFTPNGKLTTASVGHHTVVNLSTYRAVRFTTRSTAIRRSLPTSSRGSYPAVEVPVGISELGISSLTPYVGYSGVRGTVEIM